MTAKAHRNQILVTASSHRSNSRGKGYLCQILVTTCHNITNTVKPFQENSILNAMKAAVSLNTAATILALSRSTDALTREEYLAGRLLEDGSRELMSFVSLHFVVEQILLIVPRVRNEKS